MHFVFILILEVLILFLFSKKVIKDVWSLLYIIFKDENKKRYVFALLFLPGTFIHELSHFLSALFLFVPVRQFDLMYVKKDDSLVMGSTPVAKTDPVRSFIISTAPLFAGLAVMVLTSAYVFDKTLVYQVLAGIFIFQVANTMFPSAEDIKHTLGFFVLTAVVLVAGYLLGINIVIDQNGLLIQQIFLLSQKAVYYLMFPILLDFILVLMFNLFIGIRRV